MASYVPEEVVVKILSRLPPKSLIRFKCVSKRWQALIGNPDFLSENLLNHFIVTQNPIDPLRHIIFFARDKYDRGTQIHSFRSYDSLHCASQTPLKLPPAPTFDIVASCNGILCLWAYVPSDVYLWNPAKSSELKALPAASSHRRRTVDVDQVGFGFDSRSNDLKVVRLLRVVDEDGTGWYLEEIYSLRCGSWRQLDPSGDFQIYEGSRSAALDGVFLWYQDGEYEDNEIIVAFDFSDEEFRTMLFPDARFFRDYGRCTRTVTELKGSLAMFVFPHRKKNMYSDVWVMLEFGVRESWTRLLSIRVPLHLKSPLGFWKNGQLFIENRKGQLVLYDLFAQTETNLQFEGSRDTFQVVDYKLSSVLINGGEDNP
ncbi:F-box/kelch-repeat protein At3g06240-like [Alnus glutinosa]|uniref:F-box/kelch-repeat protein At3g06240-like n=1 Tax=Alnus glutinosa TaxID=3517 RepID=UPI002D768345|nr:F-box/kelch-repeat protein At3g06240-like [Alnus glutinosa]